ncbi:hypothetical protein H9L39_01110 [Fusarium oxysporum f. sp. albedinis]|nr:hypothetical protein H9L39_01110 [Fusarium oxysporum f. sp. albedinis]
MLRRAVKQLVTSAFCATSTPSGGFKFLRVLLVSIDLETGSPLLQPRLPWTLGRRESQAANQQQLTCPSTCCLAPRFRVVQELTCFGVHPYLVNQR